MAKKGLKHIDLRKDFRKEVGIKIFLLSWNKKKYDWRFNQKSMYWSTGTNRQLKHGDYVFIIKLGEEPRGLVAFAKVVSGVEDIYWNYRGSEGPGVKIKFIEKHIPTEQCVVTIELLKEKFPQVTWSSQNCLQIPGNIGIKLIRIWELSGILGQINNRIEDL